MKNLNYEIEKIKFEVSQREIVFKKINDLENLKTNPSINEEQAQIIDKKIEELKIENKAKQIKGIAKLKKFRLSLERTSEIDENPQFIYPNLLVSGKNIMLFGESGIGKTLMCAAFANYALENRTISGAIFFDFDNGLISLKKRKYDELAEIWGDGKFDYLLGYEIMQEMEAIDAIRELVLDGSKNKNKMIVIDSGSHIVYDGSKNERVKLKEFFDVIRILKVQGATPIIIHHAHRVRDGQIADYHGSFEWKRDLDYQILITKNDQSNTWLFHIKKDRDNLIESKAFKYIEETVSLYEVDFNESNISQQEYFFIKEIINILKDLNEKINQSDLMKESKNIRTSIGLGEKRFIKWLQIWAERGKWNCEKIPSEKNSIFYWIDQQTEKLTKLAKQQ